MISGRAIVFQFINDVPIRILYHRTPNLYLSSRRLQPRRRHRRQRGRLRGAGLAAAPLWAALFPLAAILVAGVAVSEERAAKRVAR
ncbi:Hypothetical protein BN69_1117 [Methylocystis sp. SC2]|nr:Hypothetical protein BN69_1117 [Methylocystis sp. SC2]